MTTLRIRAAEIAIAVLSSVRRLRAGATLRAERGAASPGGFFGRFAMRSLCSLCRGRCARFDQLLELPQIFLDLAGRIFSEQFRDRGADQTCRRIVAKHDFDFGAARAPREVNGPRISNLRALDRTPSDQGVRNLVD